MTASTATTMDAIEIADFLKRQATGVLSMGRGDDGYGIPVSYVYDDADQYVYLRLGYGEESRKREYVRASEHVSLVVYEDTDEGWKSVVVRGPIEELAATTLESSVVEAVEELHIPYFRVHERHTEDMEFTLARIDPATIDGIVEGGDRR
jgi:hypothetical protein